ncbi:MAG: hypothetical protein P8N72_00720 [Flavimaricola sp.]|nr:hypothetical protein [Flavimaricola sp.]
MIFLTNLDGLWLERWIDPEKMLRKNAKPIGFELLEAMLGPIQGPDAAREGERPRP